MKFHLVSGGCGFVGRNMVKYLYKNTNDFIILVDDLSVGIDPEQWLDVAMVETQCNAKIFGEDRRVIFYEEDFRNFLRNEKAYSGSISNFSKQSFSKFNDVFHFAAIVGGRATIDGDPMKVALDLAIDAEFFYWVTRHKPERVLYPSSSAAYPVNLQTEEHSIALSESDIDFDNMGQPDMTYGWSKLTGEYLAKITAEHYNISVTCIRPFSGYGEDQDLTYPIPAIARRIANRENPVEVWGTGDQGRDFVHIDDVIDCIMIAMDQIQDGSAINIGRGELTSFRDIITTLTEIAGYNAEIKTLLDKPVGVHNRYSNMDYVFQNLKWRPKISLKEGMTRVYHAALEKMNKENN